MARRYKYDESKFKPGQREAAIALVEYEFTPKGERKTKQQIADEIGISRMQLYNWDTKDENFIAYKNHIASNFVDSNLAFVHKKLLDAIDQGSVRAIDLFYKRMGELTDQQEITIKDGKDDASFEERKAELLSRLGVEGGKDDVYDESGSVDESDSEKD